MCVCIYDKDRKTDRDQKRKKIKRMINQMDTTTVCSPVPSIDCYDAKTEISFTIV